METTVYTDGGLTATVDADALENCRNEIYEALDNGADYESVADILSGDLGLEMDYVMDILGM